MACQVRHFRIAHAGDVAQAARPSAAPLRRMLITNLTAGSALWVRVRTRLNNNPYGPWNNPRKIIVI
jgi:hypothetical protein